MKFNSAVRWVMTEVDKNGKPVMSNLISHAGNSDTLCPKIVTGKKHPKQFK